MFLFGKRRKKSWEINLEADQKREQASDLSKAGVQANSEGRYAEAIEYWGKAIELDPDSYPFYEMRALAHENNGDYASAIEDFQHVIDFGSNSPSLLAMMGVNYRKLGRSADAIRCFEKAKDLDPGDSDLYDADIARTREELG